MPTVASSIMIMGIVNHNNFALRMELFGCEPGGYIKGRPGFCYAIDWRRTSYKALYLVEVLSYTIQYVCMYVHWVLFKIDNSCDFIIK